MKRFLLILFLTISAVSLFSQDTVRSYEFIPKTFYIGDRVDLRVQLKSSVVNNLVVQSSMPAVEWGVIHSIRVAESAQGLEVRIQFTAYHPGTHSLPAVSLGTIELTGITIHVKSLLENQQLMPLHEQIMLPSTMFYLSLGIAILLAIPVLAYLIFVVGRKQLLSIVETYQRSQPLRALKKTLVQLENNCDIIDARDFYIQLLEYMRRYLAMRITEACLFATTSELEELLSHSLKKEDYNRLVDLFRHGDAVKFGHLPSSSQKRHENLQLTKDIIQDLEKGGVDADL